MNNDLTIIYYTANAIPEHFMKRIQEQIRVASDGAEIISVSQKPIDFGKNICVGEIGISTYNVYKQILIGIREAKTEYVAMAEDDILYPKEHFKYRPKDNMFSYDMAIWSIFTWSKPPIFSYKERKNMSGLIVRREALLKTLEERFEKYPDKNNIPEIFFGEPGRFENHLGITTVEKEGIVCNVPCVKFCTESALAFQSLGKRKAHSKERASYVAPWGNADKILEIYNTI